MADDQETIVFDNGYFDESLIDPRLRSNTAEMDGTGCQTQSATTDMVRGSTPASAAALPLPTASPLAFTQGETHDFNFDEIEIMDSERDTALPSSAYQSLDFIVGSDDMVHDESERLWLIGLQAGIGLGITEAREAVLNEMMYANTVFSRPIQSCPSDPSPYDMRMYIGQRCMTGFDLRVALRASQKFVASSMQLIDVIVENGLTACLPEYGSPLPGTYAFFTDEDLAHCHANSHRIDEALKLIGIHPEPNFGTENGIDTEEPALLTASFEGDGRFIGGHDMTRLTGTAALVANAWKEKIRAQYGSSVVSNPQFVANGPGAALCEPHPTGDTDLATRTGEDNQSDRTTHEDVYSREKTPSDKVDAEPKAKEAATWATKAVTRPIYGCETRQNTQDVHCSSSSSDEDPVELHYAYSRPRPSLVETKSGRAVIRTVGPRRKTE